MKVKYEQPKMEVIVFEVEDVITSSGENEVPIEWNDKG